MLLLLSEADRRSLRVGDHRWGLAWIQGWQGRWVARVAGRQNVATPAGSRVATKRTGSLFEPKISIIFLLVGPDPVITRSSILLKHNSCQHLVEMCIYIHALIYSLILQSKLIF